MDSSISISNLAFLPVRKSTSSYHQFSPNFILATLYDPGKSCSLLSEDSLGRRAGSIWNSDDDGNDSNLIRAHSTTFRIRLRIIGGKLVNDSTLIYRHSLASKVLVIFRNF